MKPCPIRVAPTDFLIRVELKQNYKFRRSDLTAIVHDSGGAERKETCMVQETDDRLRSLLELLGNVQDMVRDEILRQNGFVVDEDDKLVFVEAKSSREARADDIIAECTCPDGWFPKKQRDVLRLLPHGHHGVLAHHKTCAKWKSSILPQGSLVRIKRSGLEAEVHAYDPKKQWYELTEVGGVGHAVEQMGSYPITELEVLYWPIDKSH